MASSPTAALLASMRDWHHVVGFGTIVLYRMNQEVGWTRGTPSPGGNVMGEVLTLAGAACSLATFDEQRVFELVQAQTGAGVAMVFNEPEAKILGRAIDLALRMIARKDQSVHCAGRLGDLMQELVRYLYADPSVVESERAYEAALARALSASGSAPVTPEIMRSVPEFQRKPPAGHVLAGRGQPWTEAFGPAASAYQGHTWRDPFDDEFLRDGRDPQTTRKGHVEGW